MALYRKSFGLDIGANAIKAIEIGDIENDTVEILGMAELPLASGIIENYRVMDAESLAREIKKLLKLTKPKAISTPYVYLNLPEAKTFTHFFEIAKEKTNVKDIREIVLTEIENIVPIEIANLYWDYKIIDDPKSDNLDIFFAAVEADIVEEYMTVCKLAGLKPLAFDLESLSIMRAIIKVSCPLPLILVDFGGATSEISLFDCQGIRMTRNVTVAGGSITHALKEQLNIPDKKAEELKRQIGLSPQKGENLKIRKIIEAEMEPIFEAIKQTVKYLDYKFNQKVSRIIVTGGSSRLPYLPEYFKEKFNIHTEMAQSWLKVKNGDSKFNSSVFLLPLGLAIKNYFKRAVVLDFNLLANYKSVGKKKMFDFSNFRNLYFTKNLGLFILLFILIVSVALLGVVYWIKVIQPQQISNLYQYDILDDSETAEQLVEIKSNFTINFTNFSLDSIDYNKMNFNDYSAVDIDNNSVITAILANKEIENSAEFAPADYTTSVLVQADIDLAVNKIRTVNQVTFDGLINSKINNRALILPLFIENNIQQEISAKPNTRVEGKYIVKVKEELAKFIVSPVALKQFLISLNIITVDENINDYQYQLVTFDRGASSAIIKLIKPQQ